MEKLIFIYSTLILLIQLGDYLFGGFIVDQGEIGTVHYILRGILLLIVVL